MRRAVFAACLGGVLLLAGFAFAAGLPGIPKAFQPYRSWHKLNAKPILPTPTTVHPAVTKNVYASKRRVGARFPYGTLVVKEGLDRVGSKRFVSLIATMRKVRGANPKNGDWIWVEYARSSPSERFSVLAQGSLCSDCHRMARANDWLFTKR